ncbi:phosphotransferase [Coraliomargarita algicola]|uniref:Phosphotransferase n=1 Tax=Coraliomargarita algicola TaxID=3092156 RepID=A0ABZ0RLQ7_9BACT|nr:phosphotransferase [Coraliomargarita sp. J2-16]WPJ96174.1 phosphotransferase [Coraliomargarita sp. J2-16]
MKDTIATILIKCTQAREVKAMGVLQKLWSGYGSIVRYRLVGAELSSVIVKHVSPPTASAHPRGWNTDISHQRKLRSYAVETAWYRDFADQCDVNCRVPRCLDLFCAGEEVVMVLEDLDAAGFPIRKQSVSGTELVACLSWLAHFHATFLGVSEAGLWPSGCYWHLETRPDELQVLAREDPALYAAAQAIDLKLKASRYQTLVHGDAKLANFCFSEDGRSVAAVDFQYVGRGCGMKDVVYFIGSCLSEDECEREEAPLLEQYFEALRRAFVSQGKDVDVDALEADWRALYPVAWTDFHRFLKGWSPGHWKINTYSEQLAASVLAEIQLEGRCK